MAQFRFCYIYYFFIYIHLYTFINGISLAKLFPYYIRGCPCQDSSLVHIPQDGRITREFIFSTNGVQSPIPILLQCVPRGTLIVYNLIFNIYYILFIIKYLLLFNFSIFIMFKLFFHVLLFMFFM